MGERGSGEEDGTGKKQVKGTWRGEMWERGKCKQKKCRTVD